MTAVVRRDAVAIAGPARTVIEGPRRHGAILGSSADWTYVHVDGFVLVLGSSSPLPNAIELGDPLPAMDPRRGDAVIGGMSIAFTHAAVHVPSWVRTWDASVPRWSSASELASRAGEMGRALGLRDLDVGDAGARAVAAVARAGCGTWALHLAPLLAGLADGEVRPAAAAARTILGAGAGLTPEADDALWAILLVLHAAAPALSIGTTELRTWRSALCPPGAGSRTTRLSATLLRLAARGRGPAPALRALSPSPGWERGMEELWSLGHSTGRVACVAMAAAMSSLAGRERARPAAAAPAGVAFDAFEMPTHEGGGHDGV